MRSLSLRGTLALLGALAAAGSLQPSPAVAVPTAAFTIRAVAIPRFPGTGDILGAGAVIQGTAKISGTEYGGAAPPLLGVRFYAPHGAVLNPRGFATCSPTVLEQSGPRLCPRRSVAGPKGFAIGTVSFGEERVPERASVQPFFAPGGGLTAFIDGTTPVLVEVLAKARLLQSSPPFGPELTGEIPLIETVPGALDASFEEGAVSVGAAYKLGGRTVSYITLPKRCPPGGWPTKAEVSFLGGATAQATYTMPCPPR